MDAQEWRQTRDALLEVVETQKRQLAQMARMLEIQRQEHEQTRERINQALTSLLAGARELGEGGQRLAQEVMHTLGSQGRQRIGEALGQPLEDAKTGIDLAARRMTQSGEMAARQLEGLARSHRAFARMSLVWLGVGGLPADGNISLDMADGTPGAPVRRRGRSGGPDQPGRPGQVRRRPLRQCRRRRSRARRPSAVSTRQGQVRGGRDSVSP